MTTSLLTPHGIGIKHSSISASGVFTALPGSSSNVIKGFRRICQPSCAQSLRTKCSSAEKRDGPPPSPNAQYREDENPAFMCTRRGALQAAGLALLPAMTSSPVIASSGPVIATPSSIFSRVEMELERRVTQFTLANGMKFVVLERHKAPIVSCHTYADVGAANEEDGKTGLAHLLEHMAFKGTPRIGTSNYRAEARLLDQMDEVFFELREAKNMGNLQQAAELKKQLTQLQDEADRYAVPNEFGSILSREGGVGLNAETSHDSTKYFVSLPTNKLELWMALESERFRYPVFRELYREKDVVLDERRLRVDNSPVGRFLERFSHGAFQTHPYGRPVIGYETDIKSFGRWDVKEFFERHYTPQALTVAIVGDVRPEEVEAMAVKYFGPWAGPSSSLLAGGSTAVQNPALNMTGSFLPEVRVSLPAEPFVWQGYHRPASTSPSDTSISALCSILSGGRLGRFYKNLIIKGRALDADATESFPGDKYPNLVIIGGSPPPGTSTDQFSALLTNELRGVTHAQVNPHDLARVKKAGRASAQASLGSNSSMARVVAECVGQTGSWRELITQLTALEGVTTTDLQRTAEFLFRADNCTVGHLMHAKSA